MSHTIVIVPEDGTIGIEGNFLLNIEPQYLSWVPENVHAFHWYADRNEGEIQFKHHPFDPVPPNERVTELGIFEQVYVTFQEESLRRAQKEAEELATLEASRDYWVEFRRARDYKLLESDWTQLVDSPLTEEQKELWAIYRQQLRDLPDIIEDPEPLVNDPNHPSWPIPPN